MGTDIHGRVEVRWNEKEKWRDAGEIERSRCYLAFAILANVRNGFGFAGVPTHETILPISEPRGLPDDANYIYKIWITGNTQAEIECDYGDHSQSWLTIDEILSWPHWNDKLQQHGVLSRAEYERIHREIDVPKTWCGDAWGSGIVMADEKNKPEGWTHIRYSWEDGPIKSLVTPYYEWFQYLAAAHGAKNCRIVFGFDS